MCINGGNDKETVKMNDTNVPRVKEFKYLGSTVQESGNCEREIKIDWSETTQKEN